MEKKTWLILISMVLFLVVGCLFLMHFDNHVEKKVDLKVIDSGNYSVKLRQDQQRLRIEEIRIIQNLDRLNEQIKKDYEFITMCLLFLGTDQDNLSVTEYISVPRSDVSCLYARTHIRRDLMIAQLTVLQDKLLDNLNQQRSIEEVFEPIKTTSSILYEIEFQEKIDDLFNYISSPLDEFSIDEVIRRLDVSIFRYEMRTGLPFAEYQEYFML